MSGTPTCTSTVASRLRWMVARGALLLAQRQRSVVADSLELKARYFWLSATQQCWTAVATSWQPSLESET